jgi:membrane protease YdiL (CAAX protease family)
MKNFWKGFGWFLMSTVPLVAGLLMQVIIGGIGMAIHGLVITLRDGVQYADVDVFMEAYLENFMAGASTGIFAYHVVATGIFFLWYYLMCVRPVRNVPRTGKVLTGRMVGWSVVIGITLCVFSTQMVKIGEYFVPEVVNEFYELLEHAGFGINVLAIIATVVLAPFGEELLCRGIIQHFAMKISRHFWVANVIQALMFGIMHMNLVQGTYAFFIGLALGWLRHRYKTLWVPIIIHFVVNFSTSTWLGYLLSEIPGSLSVDLGLFVLATAATLGILVMIGKGEKAAGEMPPHE